MRKIFMILLALLLLTALALPALAFSGSVSLGASVSNLYRGDTFSVTASLNSSDAIALGTVKLSFDSSVLELTGGSCHVAGATLGQVIPSSKAGTFMLSGDPAVISGKIFTFQFRVKENAPFGSYTISSIASIGVSTGEPISSSSVTINVACRHNYGNCTNVDNANHVSTCSICGGTKTDAHTWNKGTVTKAATCKEIGSRRLTCTGCGATKDETIPVTNDHKYGKWSESGSGHSRTCSVCNKKASASHTWNNGKVLTAATCTAAGSKKLTCTGCGATKTVTVPKTAHTYGASTYVDEQRHTHKCTACGLESTEAHDYGKDLVHDANWHLRKCVGCGHEKDQAAHVPGPEATETTDQICTVCSRILQPKGEHVHKFAEEWSADETGHWYACSSCNEKDSAAPHEYDSDCDADCNICQAQREPLHPADSQWSTDETGHWYACTACGEKIRFSPHTPGPEATISSAQCCTVCQFEIAPVLPHDHVFDAEGTSHSHYCACGEVYTADAKACEVCKDFPWWIVCIAEGVVFAGVLLWLLLWKKRRDDI